MRFIIFVSLAVFPVNSHAQRRSISGFVMDSLSHEVLIGANIRYSASGTSTNEFGYFSIVTDDTASFLYVSYVGYRSGKINVAGRKTVTVFLQEHSSKIEDVTVEGYRSAAMSRNRISKKEITRIPNIGGEVDLMKAIQLLPGVRAGFEGNSNLFVRGGTFDQNLILLDDIHLYNVSHLGNIFSTFNADAVNDVTLIKGAFPAKYGGRLSSVLDVRMKDGNREHSEGSAGIGLLSMKLLLEGPVEKDRSSYMVSLRKNTLPVFKLFFDEGLGYRYYDSYVKLNRKMSANDNLYVSFYSGNDAMIAKSGESGHQSVFKNKVNWSNLSGSVRWNHRFKNNIFLHTVAGTTNYNYRIEYISETTFDSGSNSIDNTFRSKINDFLLKSNIDCRFSDKYKLVSGIGLTRHRFTPGTSRIRQKGTNINEMDKTTGYDITRSMYSYIYVENLFSVGKYLQANIGLHASDFYVRKENFYSVEPRISMSINLPGRITVGGAYSEMLQYIHLLNYSGAGFPSDYFVPSIAGVPPERSQQSTFSVNKRLSDSYVITFEGYYKNLDHQIAFKPGASYTSSAGNWEDRIETGGTGTAKGLELMLQKTNGKISGWFNTTLSRSERQFENMNNGKPFPYKYDRTWEINLVLMYDICSKFSFSASWVYGSGSPVTLPVAGYPTNDSDYPVVFHYEGINKVRMKDYHRLDAALQYTVEHAKRGKSVWNFSIFNVYNRKNPYYYYFSRDINDNGRYNLHQQSLFSFFPSISYHFYLN